MGNGGNWSDILNETGSFPTRYDAIRHKYIEELQNAVLSLHHSLMITLQQTPASKIIESSQNAYIVSDLD